MVEQAEVTSYVKVRALIFKAALDATRLKAKMRHACRSVIVGGKRQADVCRRTGLDRRDLSAAVVRVRMKITEVERYVEAARLLI